MVEQNDKEITKIDAWIDQMDMMPHPEDDIIMEQLHRYDEASRRFKKELRKILQKKPIDDAAIVNLYRKYDAKLRKITQDSRVKYEKRLEKGGA